MFYLSAYRALRIWLSFDGVMKVYSVIELILLLLYFRLVRSVMAGLHSQGSQIEIEAFLS